MSTRALTAVTALLAALSLLAVSAHATTIGETTIGKLISGVDVIVVGKVVRVVDVPAGDRGPNKEPAPTLRIAEVEVVQWLKGQPRPKRIWYLADGTCDADLSTAIPGERSLLFLTHPLGRFESHEPDVDARLKSPAFRRGVRAMTGGEPLLQDGFWGRGRMPLDRVEGADYATIDAWHVHLPADVATIPGADPRFMDTERRVPLATLNGLVQRRLLPLAPPEDKKAAPVLRLLERLDSDVCVEPSREDDKLLEELGEEPLPVLLDLLDDPAFPRRDTVAEAIEWLGGWLDRRVPGKGMDALLEGLRSKDVARRSAAAFALEWIARAGLAAPDEARLPEVFKATADPDPGVRARAVAAVGALEALGAIDAPDQGFPAVVRALRDESVAVRRSALRTLTWMRVRFRYVEEHNAAAAEAALLPLRTHGDVDVRREVWEVLAYVAGPATLSAALAALEDADRVVRVHALRALGRIPDATERLGRSLALEDLWARRTAAYALGLGGLASRVAPLVRALEDEDDLVVRIAVEALGEIGPPAAAAGPALERLLENKRSAHWRSYVEEALEKIRG